MLITVTLFLLAIINVLTKKVATISGITFTIAFFISSSSPRRYNQTATRCRHASGHGESSAWIRREDLSSESVHVRPGNMLVAVRNPHRLQHCRTCSRRPTRARSDIVVLSVQS